MAVACCFLDSIRVVQRYSIDRKVFSMIILLILTTMAIALGIACFLAGAFAIFKVGEWQKEQEDKNNGF